MKVISNLPKLVIGVFAAILAVLLGYLSFYNCPSIFDDYCFACTARNYGFWTAQKMYYEGWTGRYFTNFLFHINPLYFSDNRIAYIILPLVLFVGFICNLTWFFNSFFKETAILKNSIFLALAFACLYYLELPSIVENNFWVIGSYTFISGNMVILLLSMMLRYKLGNKVENQAFLGAIAVLYFLILGSSEVSMLCCSALIFFLLITNLVKYRKLLKEDVLMIALTALGNYLVVSAPGNNIRNPVKRAIVDTIFDNFEISVSFFLEWTLNSPILIIATAAYLLFLFENRISKDYLKIPLLSSIGISLVIFYVSFIPTSFGMGDEPPPRILNLIYLIFLLSWFYNITILGTYFNIKGVESFKNISNIVVIALFLFFAYKNENLKQMYRDIKYKKVQAYLQEYQERIVLLKSSDIEVVYLKPIQNKPFSLYTGDITKDPKHLWNRCLANYYNKKEIYLENFNQ